MNKQDIVTESPAKEARWIDTQFIHRQHGTFTNQVLTEFRYGYSALNLILVTKEHCGYRLDTGTGVSNILLQQ